MIPFQLFIFEKNQGKQREHYKRDDLLNDFELNECERSAVVAEADSIGWHHEAIFEKRDEPTGEDEADQTCFLEKFQFVK